LGLPTFEDTMRTKVGKVIPVEEVANVHRHASELLNSTHAHAARLEELRASLVYNLGNSARVGASIIDQMLTERATTLAGDGTTDRPKRSSDL
jgi:hypothetical protein